MRKQSRIPCGSRPRSCSRPISAGRTLADLVQQYNRDHEHDPSVALADCRDLAEAVQRATGSVGKVPSHQRRVGRRILKEACKRLLGHQDEIRACRSFAELIALVERATEGIFRFGELAVYDTAFRLGVWLKLWPKMVCLHAGTRVNAKALGLNVRRGCVDMAELPAEVRVLKPWQAEDFLCIFKRELAAVRQQTAEGRLRPIAAANADAAIPNLGEHRAGQPGLSNTRLLSKLKSLHRRLATQLALRSVRDDNQCRCEAPS